MNIAQSSGISGVTCPWWSTVPCNMMQKYPLQLMYSKIQYTSYRMRTCIQINGCDVVQKLSMTSWRLQRQRNYRTHIFQVVWNPLCLSNPDVDLCKLKWLVTTLEAIGNSNLPDGNSHVLLPVHWHPHVSCLLLKLQGQLAAFCGIWPCSSWSPAATAHHSRSSGLPIPTNCSMYFGPRNSGLWFAGGSREGHPPSSPSLLPPQTHYSQGEVTHYT